MALTRRASVARYRQPREMMSPPCTGRSQFWTPKDPADRRARGESVDSGGHHRDDTQSRGLVRRQRRGGARGGDAEQTSGLAQRVQQASRDARGGLGTLFEHGGDHRRDGEDVPAPKTASAPTIAGQGAWPVSSPAAKGHITL
jgi:hypothetical protein